ncbi:WD40-like Beta Propeller Repeat [Armatimonadetes bacterium GBS]|jgi:hypothetical protein|nr:WD40-like Beta Propeller Repeat [Armatimonadetes bacterium GBS]CUU36908.1 WD40-like Beta Propeller Repeat [Armatimonadetes bacterium GXS]
MQIQRNYSDVSFDLHPKQDLVVFTAHGDGGRDIYLLDLRTRRVERLTRSSWWEKNPRWTPDGRAIIYEARRDASNPRDSWNLYMLRLADRKVQQLTFARGAAHMFVCFLPDPSQILIARTTKLGPDLLWDWSAGRYQVLDISRRNLRNFPALWGKWYLYGFSPAGDRVLAARPVIRGQPDLYVLESQPLLQRGGARGQKIGAGTDAVWVLSRNQIAFVAPAGGSYEDELWTVGVDGKGLSQRTRMGGGVSNLRVDSKQNFIYFLRVEDGSTMLSSLWRLHLPTGRVEKVADTRLFSDPLAFSKPQKRP